jgi:hypothetical protein
MPAPGPTPSRLIAGRPDREATSLIGNGEGEDVGRGQPAGESHGLLDELDRAELFGPDERDYGAVDPSPSGPARAVNIVGGVGRRVVIGPRGAPRRWGSPAPQGRWRRER